MISYAELLMGREAEYPLTIQMKKNLDRLYAAINKIRQAYGKPMTVTSGYRPGHYNKAAGGAKRSAHLTCEAVDIADPDGKLASWCMLNLDKLSEAGLWLESPARTRGWTHLQIRSVGKSRVFEP